MGRTLGPHSGRLVAKAGWFGQISWVGTTEQSPPFIVGVLGKRAGRAGPD